MGDFEKSLQNLDTNLIYDQISKIDIPLEMQSMYNHHYIDQKIVECDKALDALDKVNTKVIRELTNYEIRQSIVEEEINNKKRNEFANNQELLKKYATGKERESAIELLMKDSMAEFNKLNRKILALRSLSGLIKTKQSIIIKKMRSIQDQFKMMSDLLRVNVPLPEDKDTAKLMKALGNVEELERNIEAEEATESIEQNDDITVGSKGNTDIVLESDSMPSDVTVQESKVSSSTEVDISDLDLGNTDSKGSSVVEPNSASPEEESKTSNGENPEDDGDSDLDMDTVLDGLDDMPEGDAPFDIDSGPTDNASAVDAEVVESTNVSSEKDTSVEIDQSPAEIVDESSENTILEDILSENVPVVTDKPAKKPGQGEPSSKEKNPKTVLKEDTATIPGDINIDNILDDLSNL